jgi:hypothetical protein
MAKEDAGTAAFAERRRITVGETAIARHPTAESLAAARSRFFYRDVRRLPW